MDDKPIELAAVTGAHGIHGEVRLKLFGEGVEALSKHKALRAKATGASLTLKKIRSDNKGCLLYTSPSPRDLSTSRMPSSA